MALPDNAFQAFFVLGVVILVAFLLFVFLRRGPPPGVAHLNIDKGNGLERSGLRMLVENQGGRLTSVEDLVVASGNRATSLVGLGTVLNLPRDLDPGDVVEFRVSPRELVAALERLRPQRPAFRVELTVYGGGKVVSETLAVPTSWHSRLSPVRRAERLRDSRHGDGDPHGPRSGQGRP